jgi:hypothetical protein
MKALHLDQSEGDSTGGSLTMADPDPTVLVVDGDTQGSHAPGRRLSTPDTKTVGFAIGLKDRNNHGNMSCQTNAR